MSNSLGKMSLGKMSLGRIGGEMVASSGGGGPLYERILASMPDELRKSLVCWYSPSLQGLTNAELYNSDNLYEGGLRDLSGDGHNMTLYGFDGIEGGGHVDEEGNLCFDGLNDYGIIDTNNGLTEYTLFYDRKVILGEAVGVVIGSFNASQTDSDLTLFDCASVSQQYNTRGKVITNVGWKEDGLMIATYDYVEFDNIRTNINKPSLKRPLSGICIASQIVGNTKKYIAKEVCRNLVWFSRILTDTEIEWVKTNMLVSQEVSKRNVTLWLVDEESGSFDKFKTFQVQDGNMIGKYDEDGNLILPVYDIGSIYQTSLQWYTDADCTEEYGGEYITEDTFLYAKKVRTSNNMLAQLDNVVLEDGTTAREHLVCWYSPKWQGLTKASVLLDSKLSDLSGNGYDMDLYGFDSEQEIIDADGGLMFDGVNDYGMYELAEQQDWTYIFNISKVSKLATSAKHIFSVKERDVGSVMEIRTTGFWYLPNNTSGNQYSQPIGTRVLACTPTSFNELTFDRAVFRDTYPQFYLARLRSSSNLRACFTLLSHVRFDITLTTEQIEQVKTILKLQ